MYIWKGNDLGIYDTDNDKSINRKSLQLDMSGKLFSDPVVWGLASEVSDGFDRGVVFSNEDVLFLQHISSVTQCDKRNDEYLYVYGYYYMRNGVCTNLGGMNYTLLEILRDKDLSLGVVYMRHLDCGLVRIEFKESVRSFLTKLRVLVRK